MNGEHPILYQHGYSEFIDKFEYLTPYQLDHFCRILHQHYQAIIKPLNPSPEGSPTPGDMKELLISSMLAAQLELAEQKLRYAEYNLQIVKAKFTK